MEKMEIRYYLTFEFTGVADKFVYTVAEGVKNGIREELLGRNWEVHGTVIEFEDVSGRKIAVNARYIRRCQGLFDAGIYPARDERDNSQPDMMIVVEGMSKPLSYNDIEPDEAALVASVMAGVESDVCNFVSFTDEDGEDNLIPADKIMLLESIHYDDDFAEEADEDKDDK